MDGHLAISASHDGTARVWNLASGEELYCFGGQYNFGEQWQKVSLAISCAAMVAITVSVGGTISVFDLKRGCKVRCLTDFSGAQVALSSDGCTAVMSFEQGMYVWDCEKSDPEKIGEHGAAISSVRTTADGHMAASISTNGRVSVWDLQKRALLKKVDVGNKRISSAALSSDLRYCVLAPSSGQAVISVWNIEYGRKLAELQTVQFSDVGISSDGEIVAIGGNFAPIKIWRYSSEKEPQVLSKSSQCVECLTFGSNNGEVSAGCPDCSLKLWGCDNLTKAKGVPAHDNQASCVGISSDGRVAMSRSLRDTKSWEVENAMEVSAFKSPESGSGPAVIAADGQHILRVERDSSITVLSGNEWSTAISVCGHTSQVGCIALSKDGLIAASAQGGAQLRAEPLIKIWDTRSGIELQTVVHDASTS
jgi:WD40 repeat protein